MIIPIFKAPKKYVEEKRKKVEIVSVDYKVGVIVRFKEKIIYKPVEVERDSMVMLDFKSVRMEAKAYKFALKVQLTAKEYKGINVFDEEEYVTNKAKNSFEFKSEIDKLLSDMPDREYDVEIFILEDADGKIINYGKKEEWTEWVAVY